MKSCDISHQVVKTVSRNFSGAVQIQTVKAFHNIRMIRNLKIRHCRLAVSLNFYILTVIFSNRNRRINDVWNGHHDFFNLFFYFFFLSGKFLYSLGVGSYFFLRLFSLFLFSFFHQAADHFRNFISFCSQAFYFLFDLSVLLIQIDDLVYKGKFTVLEFIPDILFYDFWIFS